MILNATNHTPGQESALTPTQPPVLKQAEYRLLRRIQEVAEPFIKKVGKVDKVPWCLCAGPTTWAGYGLEPVPVFVWELDTTQISASKLVKSADLLHDISTAFGGGKFRWKNTVGLGLIFDGRAIEEVDVVEFLSGTGCALVVGPRGTGKTTLLQHVIARRNQRTIVFDPKPVSPSEGDKWLHAEVYGRGGNFEEIAEKLSEIEQAMNRGGYGERILVIVDEYWITQKQVDIATDVFRIVTLGREPGIDIFIGTHSQRVKGLGIDGEGDLRDAFDIVRLRNGFKATLIHNCVESTVEHPGPFLKEAYDQPEPEPEPVVVITGPEVELSQDDKLLARVIVVKFGGEAPVNGVHKLIEQQLPKRYWEPSTGAPFTYGKLATTFRDWQKAGLLTPPPTERNIDGSLKSRRVTQKLLDAAGLSQDIG